MKVIKASLLVTWWSHWAIMSELAKSISMRFQTIAPEGAEKLTKTKQNILIIFFFFILSTRDCEINVDDTLRIDTVNFVTFSSIQFHFVFRKKQCSKILRFIFVYLIVT